jgi:hypothetical protein
MWQLPKAQNATLFSSILLLIVYHSFAVLVFVVQEGASGKARQYPLQIHNNPLQSRV